MNCPVLYEFGFLWNGNICQVHLYGSTMDMKTSTRNLANGDIFLEWLLQVRSLTYYFFHGFGLTIFQLILASIARAPPFASVRSQGGDR